MLTPAWIESRIDLFETFCLPSIAGQTCRHFDWLIRFGADTPPDLEEHVARWRRMANITPVWDGESARSAIAPRIGTGETLLLTTRLDSDDGLHCEFVETIQSSLSQAPAEVLDPPLGYSLTVPEGDLRLLRYEVGPFLTLAERVTGPPQRTIRSVQHTDAPTLAPVREFGDGPLWLQVVHGRNLQNYPRGERCGPPALRAAFNLGPEVRVCEPE